MNRNEEASRLAEELLTDIELDRLELEKCLFKARRLARLVGDDGITQWLAWETNGYPNTPESRRWITATGRWIKQAEDQAYWGSLSTLQQFVVAQREKLKSMGGDFNVSGDWAYRVSLDRNAMLNGAAEGVAKVAAICSRVQGHIYDFVARTHYELLFSAVQADLFAAAQADIDAQLAQSGAALDKVESVNTRLRDGDPEAVSGAMNTCRRLIDSVADMVFPAAEGTYDIDGQPVAIDAQRTLNRLNAHLHREGVSKGRRDRLRRTLMDLYGRTSAGVHADVTVDEAKFLFLHTYVVLGEVLSAAPPVSAPPGGAHPPVRQASEQGPS